MRGSYLQLISNTALHITLLSFVSCLEIHVFKIDLPQSRSRRNRFVPSKQTLKWTNKNTKQSHACSRHELRKYSCEQITNNLQFPVFALNWRLNTLEMQWWSGSKPRLLSPGATYCSLLMCDRVSEAASSIRIRKVIVFDSVFFRIWPEPSSTCTFHSYLPGFNSFGLQETMKIRSLFWRNAYVISSQKKQSGSFYLWVDKGEFKSQTKGSLSKHDGDGSENHIWKCNFAFLQSIFSYSKSLCLKNVF